MMSKLSPSEQSAVAVHQSRLNDHTLSKQEHEISRNAIQEIMGQGPFGLIKVLTKRIEALEARLLALEGTTDWEVGAIVVDVPAAEKAIKKDGRGRPPGAKNKKTADKSVAEEAKIAFKPKEEDDLGLENL